MKSNIIERKTDKPFTAIRQDPISITDEEEPLFCDTSPSESIVNEAVNCAGCGENYYQTRLTEEYIFQ